MQFRICQRNHLSLYRTGIILLVFFLSFACNSPDKLPLIVPSCTGYFVAMLRRAPLVNVVRKCQEMSGTIACGAVVYSVYKICFNYIDQTAKVSGQ